MDSQFLLPFGLNQLGSVLYLDCLSHLSVSFAVPTVNALTMVCTAVTGSAMGERQRWNKRTIGGMVLLLAGVTLCILAQHSDPSGQTEGHTAAAAALAHVSPQLEVVAPALTDPPPTFA